MPATAACITHAPSLSVTLPEAVEKEKSGPDGKDLAWYARLNLGVFLWNIISQHPTRPLSDHDVARQKQDHSTIRREHR